MFCPSAKSLRVALLTAAVLAIPALVGSFTASAQDWQRVLLAPVPNEQAALSAARNMLESLGEIRNLEATFPSMADQLQRLAQNDPIFRNVKFDVRQLVLTLLKEHKEVIITEITKAHAAYFTADEMQRLAAFFGGPLGVRFQLLTRAFVANHNVDRQKAREEAAILIGLLPAEKAELDAFVKTADFQKFVRLQPVVAAAVKDIGRRWGTKIYKDMLDAAIRERSSQSALSART